MKHRFGSQHPAGAPALRFRSTGSPTAYAAIALTAVLAACSDDRPATPTMPTLTAPRAPTLPASALTGEWEGAISTPLTGPGRLSLKVDERPGVDGSSALFGMWAVTFESGREAAQGRVSGYRLSSTALITLVPEAIAWCPQGTLLSFLNGSFQMTVDAGPTLMKGTAHYTTCTDLSHGTVELTRQ